MGFQRLATEWNCRIIGRWVFNYVRISLIFLHICVLWRIRVSCFVCSPTYLVMSHCYQLLFLSAQRCKSYRVILFCIPLFTNQVGHLWPHVRSPYEIPSHMFALLPTWFVFLSLICRKLRVLPPRGFLPRDMQTCLLVLSLTGAQASIPLTYKTGVIRPTSQRWHLWNFLSRVSEVIDPQLTRPLYHHLLTNSSCNNLSNCRCFCNANILRSLCY